MNSERIITARYKEFLLYVEWRPGDEIRGYIRHVATETMRRFESSLGLIKEIESIINRYEMPKQTFQERKWSEGIKHAGEADIMKAVSERDDISMKSPEFLITVQFRYNSSWQGSIKWLNSKKERRFRSALELIKLIDEAVEKSGLPAEDEMPSWDD
ncbi:MAG: hypothetical protein ACOYJD_06350 [Christensenellales bacterium]|jgi:hypothetical protein